MALELGPRASSGNGDLVAVYRLSWGGRLYGDIWTCGLHLNGEIAGPVIGTSALDDVAQDISKWYQAISATPGSTLEWVKLNEIDPVSKTYVSKTDTVEKLLTPPVAASGSSAIPAQMTMCVSLLTAAKRGPASRGRFYPPPTRACTSIDYQTGQVTKVNLDGMLTPTAQLIRDLNNWPGVDGAGAEVVVLGAGGAMRSVEKVAIGSIPDTQRRRRNALKETYSMVDIT